MRTNDQWKPWEQSHLTGQNFTEDAFNHSHRVGILDTETLKMTFYENPYAYNFYKIEIDSERDLEKLNSLKTNSVVSIKCKDDLVTDPDKIAQDFD